MAETTFRCESMDGKYRECRVDGVGRLMITRQLSDANCVEGRTWGHREGVVWVDAGCRADFRFTTVDKLDMFVLCESNDNKLTRCNADTGGGVRLARQISDSSCRFGRDWGYDAKGIWVSNGCRAEFGVRSAVATLPATTQFVAMNMPTVRCESINNRDHHCDADTRYGIALVRQLSENPCVQNRTWGIDDDGVWVKDGCRGEFALASTTMISSSPAPAPPPVQVTVRQPAPVTVTVVQQPGTIVCESINNARHHCRADTVNGITLLRQISDNDCVRERTWGVDKNGIWVSGGCRAEFALGMHTTAAHATAVHPDTPEARAVFVCESINGKRNHCPLNTMMGVNLLRQLSDSDCVLNKSWGVDANGVWVTDGCRAEFVLGGRVVDVRDAPSSSRVLCESVDGKRKVCSADTRMGVAVVRQISDSKCVLNSTWGFDTNGIWVTAGCRAEFILRR